MKAQKSERAKKKKEEAALKDAIIKQDRLSIIQQ